MRYQVQHVVRQMELPIMFVPIHRSLIVIRGMAITMVNVKPKDHMLPIKYKLYNYQNSIKQDTTFTATALTEGMNGRRRQCGCKNPALPIYFVGSDWASVRFFILKNQSDKADWEENETDMLINQEDIPENDSRLKCRCPNNSVYYVGMNSVQDASPDDNKKANCSEANCINGNQEGCIKKNDSDWSQEVDAFATSVVCAGLSLKGIKSKLKTECPVDRNTCTAGALGDCVDTFVRDNTYNTVICGDANADGLTDEQILPAGDYSNLSSAGCNPEFEFLRKECKNRFAFFHNNVHCGEVFESKSLTPRAVTCPVAKPNCYKKITRDQGEMNWQCVNQSSDIGDVTMQKEYELDPKGSYGAPKPSGKNCGGN